MEKLSTDNHAREANIKKDIDGVCCKQSYMGFKRLKWYLSYTEFGSE